MATLDDSPINERKRVKVYELRDNDWFDKGTGFCVVTTIAHSGRICVVSEEEPDSLLLEVTIKKDDNYQKQQETLIVWTDQTGVDMAMSFQEADGCSMVWSSIGQAQQRLLDTGHDITRLILPTPELGHLEEIEAVVRAASHTAQGRDALAKLMVSDNYITRLTTLVQDAEDLEDLPDLHRLCNVMKTLILFNDNQIIEYIVRDEVIQGAVGALEYDPDFPQHKANHRQYLADNSKFKEVVHIEDDDIRHKIHCTYRLQYLKDVALARILDDPSFSLFNSLIYFHQIDIVQHIATNAAFLKELFTIIASSETSSQKKKDAVAFLQQSCSVAKGLQAPCRASLFQNLIESGLFNTVTFALQHRDSSVRVAGTDILVAVIDHDVLTMRNNVYKSVHDKTKPMTDTLIDLLLVETDLGVKSQVADAIMVLLDSNSGTQPDRVPGADNPLMTKLRQTPANSSPQSDAFLASFFEKSAKRLFQPLKDLERRESFSNLTIQEASLYSHLVEILCFFVRQHSYRSKYFILHEGLALRVAQLMQCPEKHLKLTTIKFFKTCIVLQDDHHTRQLTQNRLFEPLLNLVKQNMPRDNLLTSACLDIFEYVRKEGIKHVVLHLGDCHRELLQSMEVIDVFRGILLRYEHFTNPNSQANNGDPESSFMTSDADTPNTRHVTLNGGALRWQGIRDADPIQDAYFNAADDYDDEDDVDDDDDEDDLSRDHRLLNGASPLAKPLVDYKDDYDDDDNDQDDGPFAQGGTTMIPESPPAKRKAGQHDPKSSSPQTPSQSEKNTSPRTPTTTPASSTSPVPPPPVSLAEKRRREEDDDDDDQLGKLSKRRNSNINLESDKPESSVSLEAEQKFEDASDLVASTNDITDEPDPPTPRQQTLRRKRGVAQLGNGGKKIAISLGGTPDKADSNDGKK